MGRGGEWGQVEAPNVEEEGNERRVAAQGKGRADEEFAELSTYPRGLFQGVGLAAEVRQSVFEPLFAPLGGHGHGAEDFGEVSDILGAAAFASDVEHVGRRPVVASDHL